MDLIIQVWLSYLAVYSVAGLSAEIQTVTVVAGQDAILPCHQELLFNVTSLMVEWTRDEKQVHLYRSQADNLRSQDKNFRNRTSLFRDEMVKGNISLKLTNVTELDAGNYTCQVRFKNVSGSNKVRTYSVTLIVESKSKPDPKISGEKSISIIEGSIGGAISLFVLVCVAAVIIWKTCGNNKPEPKADNSKTRKGCRRGRRRKNNKKNISYNMTSTSETST